ncbi:hypothetical protein LWI28_006140 [Acer negundo]|uniref:Uncharacterized protein n=1 Tax=Acer negundo TaxID=4023 RepID=A0AAD5J9Y6_ACENE|nr:hypothetical protein LWI28_006140 [Acer negundo]
MYVALLQIIQISEHNLVCFVVGTPYTGHFDADPFPPILLASAAIWIQIRDSLYLLVKQLDFVDLGFRISDCGSIDHDLERFRVHSCKGLSEFGRFRRVMLLWK